MLKRINAVIFVLVFLLVPVTVSAQTETPTPTPPPSYTPCSEPVTDPAATPSPKICAHLMVKLSQTGEGILADWYVDGLLVGLQLPNLDTTVTASKSHKIEAKSITDPVANGVYQWVMSYPVYAYLTPGTEKSATLTVYKKYLMGFLKLKCVINGLQPEDVASCLPSIDGVSAEPIAPGVTATLNLLPGKHTVDVRVAPEETWYAAPLLKSSTIYAGSSSFLTATFTPLHTIPLISGIGQTVTSPIYVQFPVSRVTFTHDGSSNFIVWVYDQDGDRDLLVNEIGPFSGSAPLPKSGSYFFEINADGNWTVKIDPLGQNNGLKSGLEGAGMYVSDLFAPSPSGFVPYHFTHTGSSNFIVWLVCGTRRDLVQNEIGPVDNEAVAHFVGTSCYWDINADGAWTIHPK